MEIRWDDKPIKVVRVKDPHTPQGYRIINADDYDESQHELYTEGAKKKPKTKKG